MSGGGRKALAARAMTGGTSEQPSADQADAAFAKSLGVEGSGPDALAQLRALPAQALVGDLSVQTILAPAVLAGVRNYDGTPMVDGTIVVGDPGEVLSRRKQARIPVIIGTTAMDLPLFFPPRTDPYSYFGPNADKAKTAYDPAVKGGIPSLPGLPVGLVPSLALLAIAADMTMHEPARFAARSVTAAGNSAWLYRFTYVIDALPTRTAGAPHAQEVSYLFDTLDAFYGASRLTDKDRRTAREFSSYIADFVKAGDPNGPGLPNWPKFDASRFDLMNFTLDDGPVFGPDPRAARIELVQEVAESRQHAKEKQTR